ncbi:MAG: TIGR03663 family protein [Sedimentisphaerales bacterium]|nr:TIGR03663 family protein [Sedimentisphaerales bacterium]
MSTANRLNEVVPLDPDTKRFRLYWLLILVVALGALVSRVPRLSLRPMHTDEAVHAAKFGDLLDRGRYEYNPHEFHGPTLNYFTLIPAWLSGARTYAAISEFTLRVVPVAFSVLLIALTALLVGGFGPATIPIALVAAVSPAMFFYSRYYIQETLLVCFTFGAIAAGYRYARTQAWPWAVVAGVFVGLMHATKETCIIAYGAMALALVLVVLMRVGRGQSLRDIAGGLRLGHIVLGLAAAVLVSALFFSPFLTHPRGVVDSYLTYGTYLTRAGGQNSVHTHPWYYYVHMLLLSRYADGPLWTEGWIVVLALVGLVVAMRGRGVAGMDPDLLRFVAFYTLALTVVYSALPYKTPWCMLSFLHGMILLAGVGAVALVARARDRRTRAVVVVLLFLPTAHLAFQAYRGSFVYEADSRNPYVYAHTTDEIFTVVDRIKAYAGLDGLGQTVPIDVACPGGDYWPLPWYLRSFQVHWSNEIPQTVGPLIIVSDQLEAALIRRLYVEAPIDQRRMYLYLFDEPYYVWLRPKVELLGFVRKDFWERQRPRPDASEFTEDQRGQ